jgi:RNA polymerase sigma-70 factor, ECF subfamily
MNQISMSDKPNMSETRLVQRCRLGNREAWDEFCENYYPVISFVVSWPKWRFMPDEQEDVIQDVMTELIKALDQFEMACSLKTFVHKISVNACIDRLRNKTTLKRRTNRLQVPLDTIGDDHSGESVSIASDPDMNQETMLLTKERISFIRKALAKLEEHCKELVTLRYLIELSFAEIAEKTGVKKNTLVVQLKRCMMRLFKMVEGEI